RSTPQIGAAGPAGDHRGRPAAPVRNPTRGREPGRTPTAAAAGGVWTAATVASNDVRHRRPESHRRRRPRHRRARTDRGRRMATLRELLQDGRPAIGGWCSIPSPVTAEIVGRSGFDWVCIDTQHGLIGYDQMVPMLQALSATGTPVLVRVPWNRPEHVMKALDAGAHGIIVPMVNTADEAARAVEAAKYPPGGTRSWGPLRAAMAAPSYSAPEANRRTFVAVMIETPEGMRN